MDRPASKEQVSQVVSGDTLYLPSVAMATARHLNEQEQRFEEPGERWFYKATRHGKWAAVAVYDENGELLGVL